MTDNDRRPATPTQVYGQLLKTGTSPALVWYGQDERIELSGKVLANHIAKIANYLVDECELEPGARVVLDLPTHWKSVAWGLAALVAGGSVVMGRDRVRDHESGTVVVTDEPTAIETDNDDVVVALNLKSLAFAWDGELPEGVEDGAASVLSHPDALMVSGVDEYSNASFFARAVRYVPEGERVAVTFPTLPSALSLGYQLISDGAGLVVINDPVKDPQDICSAEKAVYFEDFSRYAPM